MTTTGLSFSAARRALAAAAFAAIAVAGCSGPPAGSPALPAREAPAMTLATHAPTFTVYTAGQTPGFPTNAAAEDLTSGPGGTMWFTDAGTPAIGRITANGTFTEFRSGLPSTARPYVIAAAPDGSLWFSDYSGVTVGHVTVRGKIVEYGGPQPSGDSAAGIVVAADGTPWFVTFGPVPMLGHVTAARKLETFALPKDLSPDGTLAIDAAGNLWLVAVNNKSNGVMVERTPSGALVRIPMHMYHQSLPCCPHRAPKRLVIGPDGNPWFTAMDYGHKSGGAQFFGTVVGGKVQLFRLSQKGLHHAAYASGIATGPNGFFLTGGDPFNPDGALYAIGLQGSQTAYDIPYNPIAVALDRKGRAWLTAAWSGQPSQIVEVTSL